MTTYGDWLTGRGLSQTTIHARTKFYRSRLREWGSWDQPPTVLGTWLAGYEGWTRLTYHNHLTSVYDWLLVEGRIAENPMASIRKPPSPRPRPRPLTDEQMARAMGEASARTRAFLLLGYLAGLRAFEIAKIHGRDVDADQIEIMGKGGKAEAVPTHPVIWELAQTYPRDGYWFPGRGVRRHIRSADVTDAVGRLFRSIGVEGATHRARHTFGTRLLRGGANLRVVQDLMRHASLATTALYLGVDEDERWTAINGLGA